MKIDKYGYTSKKFLGFVFAIDFNRPQVINYKTYCVIEIKLFFIGLWIIVKDR